ncbi:MULTISPECIES: F0F1 ATP synthase subunit B [Convivina]|uniref:ATP synthase subunit b n=2 Tax=Convivina TaxID=1697027 RepID=A0A2U1D7X0_9LACO|nr:MULTISPECIES: F0F1 ATP synthase subunit B [Convivina]SDB93022.1 F-type H+-transporting ATPase subunit b [Leuconostocaceae bacterium R-53105]PVY83774.1 ATP synthase F0 subcomplex B subunit [Convivina intestini]CAH1851527.1 ATP synthase subunit b [Convivina sp. LMG 32447]CAH1851550.1 ATP synthase subunit b [Convivina sp. LMG 32447]CAH1853213.1 ATP synthase subunit b [Convivina sp. LMG 32447]
MLGTTLLAAKEMPLGDMLFIIVAFLVLMVILKKVAFGPLTKVLDQRADKISSDLDGAEESRQQAEQLVEQRQNELDQTRQQASEVVASAKASAQKQGEDALAKANERADSIHQQAQADATKMKADAIAGAKSEVANLSVAIASKLMQKELSVDDQRALIDAYIADLDHK